MIKVHWSSKLYCKLHTHTYIPVTAGCVCMYAFCQYHLCACSDMVSLKLYSYACPQVAVECVSFYVCVCALRSSVCAMYSWKGCVGVGGARALPEPHRSQWWLFSGSFPVTRERGREKSLRVFLFYLGYQRIRRRSADASAHEKEKASRIDWHFFNAISMHGTRAFKFTSFLRNMHQEEDCRAGWSWMHRRGRGGAEEGLMMRARDAWIRIAQIRLMKGLRKEQ